MNLIFLGPPGAGKGTTAVKISDFFQIPHISTGDLFRGHIKNQTELGRQVKSIMDQGELVPDEITIEMVRQRLREPDSTKGYILDGFPRTIHQAEALESFSRPTAVIDFELRDETIIRRLSGRRIAPSSGRVYHIDFNPPKVEGRCDVTGEELIQRPDDRPEAIQHRLKVYKKRTAPLIDFYRKKELLFPLNVEKPPSEVFEEVKKLVQNHSS
ncbi:MAG TPA: adenylate kinase [Sediminispirochaeta sp.]|nr:adenylate kinase [Sediminispirochaeta sp.]